MSFRVPTLCKDWLLILCRSLATHRRGCRETRCEPFSSDVPSLQEHHQLLHQQCLSSAPSPGGACGEPYCSALTFKLLAFSLLTCCAGLRGGGTRGAHCGRCCGGTCSWKTGLGSLTAQQNMESQHFSWMSNYDNETMCSHLRVSHTLQTFQRLQGNYSFSLLEACIFAGLALRSPDTT